MVKLIMLLSGCCFFWIQTGQAAIYKSVDENGTVSYSDKPAMVNLESAPEKHAAIQNKGFLTRNNISAPDNPGKNSAASIEMAYPDSIILRIRDLLSKKSFKKLNKELQRYQLAFENDVAAEDNLFTAYKAFKINSHSYEALLNEWVNTTPEQYQPYLARAKYYTRMGWFWRGTKWASETKKQQFEEMDAYFAKARLDIQRVIKLNKKTIIPYYLLINMSKAHDTYTGVKGASYKKYSTPADLVLAASDKLVEWIMGSGKEPYALGEAEKALHEGLKIKQGSYYLRLQYLLSITPRWGGSYNKMKDFVKESMKSSSLNPNIKLLQGVVYAEAGEMAAISKHYSQAEKYYNKALSYGEIHSVLFDRAKNSYRREDYENALNDINRAIRLYSEEASYYSWRSSIFIKTNEYIKAASDIMRASQYEPFNSTVAKKRDWLIKKLVYLGATSANDREYQWAMSCFDAALMMNPNEADTHYWRARALVGLNQRQQAMKDIKTAIGLNPKRFDYYQEMDWLLSKRGDWDQIIHYWGQYIALVPDDSRAYYELGGTYFHKGDIKSALLNAKLSADMGNPDAKKIYQRLKHNTRNN